MNPRERFDTTYFYMSYSCKNERLKRLIIIIIIEELLMLCLYTIEEDGIRKASQELSTQMTPKRPPDRDQEEMFVNIVVGAPSLLCSRF